MLNNNQANKSNYRYEGPGVALWRNTGEDGSIVAEFDNYYALKAAKDAGQITISAATDEILYGPGTHVFDTAFNKSSTNAHSIISYGCKHIGIPGKTIFDWRVDIVNKGLRDEGVFVGQGGNATRPVVYKHIIFQVTKTGRNSGAAQDSWFYWAPYITVRNCVIAFSAYSGTPSFVYHNDYTSAMIRSARLEYCLVKHGKNWQNSYSGGQEMCIVGTVFDGGLPPSYSTDDRLNCHANKTFDANWHCTDPAIDAVAGVYAGEDAWPV